MNPPESKRVIWKDWITVVVAAVGMLGAIVSGVSGLGWDVALCIGYAAFLVVFTLLALTPLATKRKSDFLVLANGSPAEVPLVSKKLRRVGWWASLVLLLGITPLTLFWSTIFPFVRVEEYAGSELSSGSGDQFYHTQPRSLRMMNSDQILQGYPAVTFTINRTSSIKMRVKTVRVLSRPFEGRELMVSIGTYPQNVVGVNRYRANLPATPGVTESVMQIAGQPSDGILSLSDSQPFAKLHIDLRSEKPGFYSAWVEVVVCDELGGRERTIRTPNHVLVYAGEP